MRTFVALYRGRTVSDASLVAVSADPRLVARVADEMLATDPELSPVGDGVLDSMADGTRRALHAVRDEARSLPADSGVLSLATRQANDEAKP